MLLKYFNSNRIGLLILLVFIPLLYWLPDFFAVQKGYETDPAGTLPGMLISYFSEHYPVIARMIALVLILTNAYLLVQLNTIHIFIPAKTQLPALFYILLAAGFNPVHMLSPALVSSTLMILVLFRLMMTYKVDGISYNFLDAGFLIALSSMIYFPTVFYFAFLLAGLLLLRPFNWREWAYAILGMTLPYLFLLSGYYLTGSSFPGFFPDLKDLSVKSGDTFSLIQWIGWFFILGMLLYASYFMITLIDSMKIQSRKMFLLFLWLFVTTGVLYEIMPGTGTDLILFAAISLAFLFSHFFYKCAKNWLNELLFSVFLLLVILLRIF